MQITVKTQEEFTSGYTKIEIRADHSETVEVVRRLFTPAEDETHEPAQERVYTAAEVGHYQATEAELLTAPLRFLVAQLEEVQKALTLTKASREHNRALHLKERERADAAEYRAEILDMNQKAERARAEVAERELEAFKASNRAIQDAVSTDKLIDALTNVDSGVHTRWLALASAVRKIRGILDLPAK